MGLMMDCYEWYFALGVIAACNGTRGAVMCMERALGVSAHVDNCRLFMSLVFHVVLPQHIGVQNGTCLAFLLVLFLPDEDLWFPKRSVSPGTAALGESSEQAVAAPKRRGRPGTASFEKLTEQAVAATELIMERYAPSQRSTLSCEYAVFVATHQKSKLLPNKPEHQKCIVTLSNSFAPSFFDLLGTWEKNPERCPECSTPILGPGRNHIIQRPVLHSVGLALAVYLTSSR